MLDNNKKIFEYLKPFDNDKISAFNDKDINEVINLVNKYYLEYRNVLDINSGVTFGVEIEMEHFKGTVEDFWPFEVAINRIVGNTNWTIKNDITLEWGRELATEIYTDNKKTWIDMRHVCEFASLYGEIDRRCAGHVNIGCQVLGNNPLYWYRFLKLWGIYENVIYRFGYGEYLNCFPFVEYSAKPIAKLIDNRMDIIKKNIDVSVFDVINSIYVPGSNIDFLKKNAVSFLGMYNFVKDYSGIIDGVRVEIRSPLGTLDEVVWQNYINFFVKLMLYCKSDNFDEDILNRRYIEVCDTFSRLDKYNEIYLEQAIELSDMIFDKNIDKIYFLRQYLKSFEVVSKGYRKARKFTVLKC